MTETNSSPPDTNTPPTVEEAGQPVVAVQSIMVAEQTQELATATTFATPDATTQRQGQVNEVRPDYSPYRTNQDQDLTPTSNNDQTTQNYEIDPTRPASTTQTRGMTTNAELIDQALRHGPEIDVRASPPVTNGTAPKCTLDGCDLPRYPGHDFCTQDHYDRYHGVMYPYNGAGRVDLLPPAYHPGALPGMATPTASILSPGQFDMQLMAQLMAGAMAQLPTMPSPGQSAEMEALHRQIDSLTRQMERTDTDSNMTMTIHNPLDHLTENQIYKTVQQRLGKNKFAGALPSTSSKTKGPILFQWEIDILAILKVLNLYPAIVGEDLTDRAQNLSAYAIMQGLTEELQTRIASQPRLTTSGQDLWTYLQATYAPRGINGMIFALTTMRDAAPEGESTPDSVRKYIDSLRVLWLFNERQICPTVTWGCKLEMLMRALEAPWATNFKFNMIQNMQRQVMAQIDDYEMTTEDGESLITGAILEILEFLATVDVDSVLAGPGRAEINATYAGGKGKGKGKGGKGKGKGKGWGKGAAGRQMLDTERARIREYYQHETEEDRAARLASRVNDTCGRCGRTGHWRMDPECRGPSDSNEAHVTEIDF